MRLVSVPERTVRHWVTGRVIDEAGVLYDPLCVTAAFYVAQGDLEVADDLPEEHADATPAADAPAETE